MKLSVVSCRGMLQAHKALYGVSCHYDATNDELLLSTTDEAGHVTVARVMPDRVVPVREVSVDRMNSRGTVLSRRACSCVSIHLVCL